MGLKIVRFMTARLLLMYCTCNLAVFLESYKERGSIITGQYSNEVRFEI